MRLKASIANNPNYKKVILFASDDGVYLFLFTTTDATFGVADLWFERVEDAKAVASDDFGVIDADWQPIADPLPGMPHDQE